MFMQDIMVNRKLFWNFGFSAPLQKRSIFLPFISLPFLLFWIIYRKQKQKRKNRIFALKRPFLSQIKC
nr:MAG TPA: acriflavine resistance protein B [Caudoviricetes sp.]